MNRIRVLTIADRLIPSNIIGIIKPMLRLQNDGDIDFNMRYTFQFTDKDIAHTDVVILCRNLRPEDLNIIELIKKYRKKLIYDIDDNFFELPLNTSIGRYHRNPIFLYVVYEMIRYADAVRVYSKSMEEITKKINPKVYLLRSYFDFSLIENIKPVTHEKIKIVYATSRGNADTLAQICIPAIEKILKEFSGKVAFYTFGSLPEQLKHLKNAHQLEYIPNYNEYISFFYKQGFDIGLAPLYDDRFHNSKTNNKFREYGAMEVCGIYSNTALYRECVTDRVTGMIVENTIESWYEAVRELIENSTLRKSIKDKAKRNILEQYSMQNTLSDWRKIFTQLDANHRPHFYNILRLKIAIMVDDDFQYPNLRKESLMTLLGFCGIQFECFNFVNANLGLVRNYDVVICFINQREHVNTWIAQLMSYAISNIIIDTLFPFVDTKKYPDIIFSNSEVQDENVFSISDCYCFDKDRLSGAVLDYLAIQSQFIQFSDLYRTGIERINNTEEVLFSLNSPVSKWAMLLSRFCGTRELQSVSLVKKTFLFPCKLVKKVSIGVICVLQKIFSPFIKKLNRTKESIVWLQQDVKNYIKINVMKKY